jgi:hypothetical protein
MIGLRDLCTPAHVYLVISMIAIIIIFFQNIANFDKYCIGTFTCNVSNVNVLFVIKILYVLFWTWILNLICNAGAPKLAWFLVLLPYIILFVMISLFMFQY